MVKELGIVTPAPGRFVMRHAAVAAVRKLSSKYLVAELKLLDGVPREPIPTQFVMVWIPGIDYLPMSIAWFRSNALHILFSVRGEGTGALSNHSGVVGLVGPLGKGLDPEVCGGKCLVVAGGTGLASVIRLVEKAKELGSYVDVVWGTKEARDVSDVPEYFRSLTGINLKVCTEDCGIGFCGRALDCVMELDLGRYDAVVASGPKGMLLGVAHHGLKSGVDPYVIVESRVDCGIGVCGSCLVGEEGLRLCVDGPAFRASQVLSFLEGGSGSA